jgi:hypothetical protein
METRTLACRPRTTNQTARSHLMHYWRRLSGQFNLRALADTSMQRQRNARRHDWWNNDAYVSYYRTIINHRNRTTTFDRSLRILFINGIAFRKRSFVRYAGFHRSWVEIESSKSGTLVRCHFPRRIHDTPPPLSERKMV